MFFWKKISVRRKSSEEVDPAEFWKHRHISDKMHHYQCFVLTAAHFSFKNIMETQVKCLVLMFRKTKDTFCILKIYKKYFDPHT